MIRQIDMSNFQTAANNYHRQQLKKEENHDEDNLTWDEALINHLGLYSTVFFTILLLIICIFWNPFSSSNIFFNSVGLLIGCIVVKYIFGGFGFTGAFMTTVKLLLSVGFAYLILYLPECMQNYLDFRSVIISAFKLNVLTFSYLIIAGGILGTAIATYLAPQVVGIEDGWLYIYSRFTAGFNTGIALAATALFLAASTTQVQPKPHSTPLNSVEEVEIACDTVTLAEEGAAEDEDNLVKLGSDKAWENYKAEYFKGNKRDVWIGNGNIGEGKVNVEFILLPDSHIVGRYKNENGTSLDINGIYDYETGHLYLMLGHKKDNTLSEWNLDHDYSLEQTEPGTHAFKGYWGSKKLPTTIKILPTILTSNNPNDKLIGEVLSLATSLESTDFTAHNSTPELSRTYQQALDAAALIETLQNSLGDEEELFHYLTGNEAPVFGNYFTFLKFLKQTDTEIIAQIAYTIPPIAQNNDADNSTKSHKIKLEKINGKWLIADWDDISALSSKWINIAEAIIKGDNTVLNNYDFDYSLFDTNTSQALQALDEYKIKYYNPQ